MESFGEIGIEAPAAIVTVPGGWVGLVVFFALVVGVAYARDVYRKRRDQDR